VPAAASPVSVRAWQLLYRTTDAKDRPAADAATVLVPRVSYPAGARPLVSYQTAEDSLDTRCAPSYTLRTGTEKELPLIASAPVKGWAVVVPDYEGAQSQWTAGIKAGRSVLDAVRATRGFDDAGLGASPVGMWGYSGGGLASAWAAELQPGYAPELTLAGVAEGGVPPDLAAVLRAADGTVFSGLALGGTVGLSRAYPEMDLDTLLNAAGQEMRERIGTMCIDQMAATFPFRRISEFTTVADPLRLPNIQRVIATNHLGGAVPSGPIYSYHAILDELIPIADDDALVAGYCAAGVAVTRYRDPASDHLTLAVTGAPGAVAYLAARFAGVPPVNTCP
jgi:hypothetical protein